MRTKGFVEGGYRFFFINEKEEKEIGYHLHDFHKCVIVYSGDVTYTIEGKAYALTQGSVLWVPAYEMHKVAIKNTVHYKRCVVYLSKDFTHQLGEWMEMQIQDIIETKMNLINLPASVNKGLLEVFPFSQEVKSQLFNAGAFIQFMELYFTAKEGLNDDIEVTSIHSEGSGIKQLDNIVAYIRQDLSKNLTIDEIAKHFFISKYYLMRKFKDFTGMTLHQFIIEERLKAATQYMKTGNTLTQAAYQSGFKNYNTFARCFKSVYHMSPREYMKMHPIRYDSWNE